MVLLLRGLTNRPRDALTTVENVPLTDVSEMRERLAAPTLLQRKSVHAASGTPPKRRPRRADGRRYAFHWCLSAEEISTAGAQEAREQAT